MVLISRASLWLIDNKLMILQLLCILNWSRQTFPCELCYSGDVGRCWAFKPAHATLSKQGSDYEITEYEDGML